MAEMNSATPILASHCSSAIKWRQKWRSVGAKRERQTSVCRSVGDALTLQSFQRMSNKYCTVEFDGACKGNPGKGGAGAVIRNSRGDVVARVNKPLGFTTSNIAEYEGLIIGMEKATEMGYKEIHARGDSQLVCKQVDGSWKVGSSNLIELSRRVNDLVGGLDEFDISHVPREYNTEADEEANKAAAYG